MKIEIILDGKPTTVTKQKLLELLSQGQVGLDVPINVDGKLTTVRAVFAANFDNVPPPNESRYNETNTGTSKGQPKLATARTIFDSNSNATHSISPARASNPDFFDTKKKCQAIGGVLLAIGCVLFVIAYNLASHNQELINDYSHKNRRSDVETWQLQHTSQNDSKERQQKFKDSYNAGREADDAYRRLSNSSYPPMLINVLYFLSALSVVCGTCLLVVSWVLLVTEEEQKHTSFSPAKPSPIDQQQQQALAEKRADEIKRRRERREKAQTAYETAKQLYDDGKFEKALACCEGLLNLSSEKDLCIKCHCLQAKIYEQFGKESEIQSACTRTIRAIKYGDAFKSAVFDELVAWEEVIDKQYLPMLADMYVMRAKTWEKQKQYRSAFNDYTSAFAIQDRSVLSDYTSAFVIQDRSPDDHFARGEVIIKLMERWNYLGGELKSIALSDFSKVPSDHVKYKETQNRIHYLHTELSGMLKTRQSGGRGWLDKKGA